MYHRHRINWLYSVIIIFHPLHDISLDNIHLGTYNLFLFCFVSNNLDADKTNKRWILSTSFTTRLGILSIWRSYRNHEFYQFTHPCHNMSCGKKKILEMIKTILTHFKQFVGFWKSRQSLQQKKSYGKTWLFLSTGILLQKCIFVTRICRKSTLFSKKIAI